jgi:hypothetical protein
MSYRARRAAEAHPEQTDRRRPAQSGPAARSGWTDVAQNPLLNTLIVVIAIVAVVYFFGGFR